jgi:CheY-like chemotaxis protein
MKALILEDNPFNKYYATQEVEDLGYHVHSTDNATEAINLAKQIPFSLILVDANVANNQLLQGIQETIRSLCESCRTKAVLLLMVKGSLDIIPPGLLQEGVSGFVPKPVTTEAVRAEILKTEHAPQSKKNQPAKSARQKPLSLPVHQTTKSIDANTCLSDKQ